MYIALIVVLIALTFGFLFARIDTLTKMCKILRDEISKMQEEIIELKKNM